jgi:16S rRNA processing protein RimM
MPSQQDELVDIGKIHKPIGLRGWCGASVFGRTLYRVATPFEIWLASTGDAPWRTVLLKVEKRAKGCAIRLDGCESREDAEALKSALIKTPMHLLPQPAENEYYHFELEGMAVRGMRGGGAIGAVKEVYNYPSTDALEIELAKGGSILAPLTPEVTVRIDRVARVVEIDECMLEELL